MNKKITTIIISLSLFIFTVSIFTFSETIIETVKFSLDLWIYKLIPTFFPLFLISELMISFGIVELLSELLKNVTSKCFGLSGNCSLVLVMSVISGFPSGAKYTRSLYDNNMITSLEASKLISFTHFANPMFIMEIIGSLVLNNKMLALLILISHYISNLLIGFFNKNKTNIKVEKVSIKKAYSLMHQKRVNDGAGFSTILANSIYKTFSTLILILGIITFFLMISSLLKIVFSFDNNISSILCGFIELTQGIYMLNSTSFTLIQKSILALIFISFGGISVHMQVSSIISGTGIKYIHFLKGRIFQTIISVIIFLIISAFIYR